MSGFRRILFQTCRKVLHTLSQDGPGKSLKQRVAEMERKRKRKDPRKNQIVVDIPESTSFADTATMPMILTVVGTALFARVLMIHVESKYQEMIETKIKKCTTWSGTVRMLTREEWEELQEVRPRMPFESKLARPNGRLTTGEPLHWEDVDEWTYDVLTNGCTRVKECVSRGSK